MLFDKYDAGSGKITPEEFRLLLEAEFNIHMNDEDIEHFVDLCSLEQDNEFSIVDVEYICSFTRSKRKRNQLRHDASGVELDRPGHVRRALAKLTRLLVLSCKPVDYFRLLVHMPTHCRPCITSRMPPTATQKILLSSAKAPKKAQVGDQTIKMHNVEAIVELHKVRGLPAPRPTYWPQVLERNVRACLFRLRDGEGTVLSNVHEVKAVWSFDMPDAWKFKAHRTGSDSGSFVLKTTVPEDLLKDTFLLVEFSILMKPPQPAVKPKDKSSKSKSSKSKKRKKRRSAAKKRKAYSSEDDSEEESSTEEDAVSDDDPRNNQRPIELSCGFCLIEMDKLRTKTPQAKVAIVGGTPRAPIKLAQTREQQVRTGWRKIKQNIRGTYKTELYFRSTPATALERRHRSEFITLAQNCLASQTWLPFLHMFKEATKSENANNSGFEAIRAWFPQLFANSTQHDIFFTEWQKQKQEFIPKGIHAHPIKESLRQGSSVLETEDIRSLA